MMQKLTDQEYLESKGLRCRECGSSDSLEGEEVNIDAGTARQDMFCHECGASWTDVYRLVRTEDLD